MDGALDAHRRCLAAMAEACGTGVLAHANQLAALERERALAAGRDLGEYLAASGDLFELARAASLDRAANQARVAAAVRDPWGARAAAAEHAAALAATGHGDWAACLGAGSAEADGLRRRGAGGRAAFVRVLLGLLSVRATADPEVRADQRMHAASALALLREADPAFDGSRLAARYRLRVPWTGAGLAAVGEWVAELAGTGAGADPDRADAEIGRALAAIADGEARWRAGLAGRVAAAGGGSAAVLDLSVEGAIAPYRALAESATGDDPVAAATRRAALAAVEAGGAAPAGPDAVARLVAGGLLADLAAAPLRGRAELALERRSVWPDPLVEHHWHALLSALGEAATPTAVELVAAHAEACLAVEGDWNALLLGSLLLPLRGAALEGRAGLRQAAEASATLLGLGPRDLAALPRVDGFVREILHPHSARDPGALGAFEGEAGFDTVVAVRARLEGSGAAPPDAGALLALLLDGAPEPPAAGRPLALWDEAVPPGDLTRALARPARPPIPGARAVADGGTGL